MAEYIEREALYKEVTEKYRDITGGSYPFNIVAHDMAQLVKSAPAADVVEVDKVAELLLLSFGGDTCACNFNGNDEWLWEKCKYAETECPTPKDELGCWKEFVKAMLAKMDGKGEGE